KSGDDCPAPTSIRQNGRVAFFSHTARLAYDLEGQGGAARQEMRKRPFRTDLHEIKETRRAIAIRC
ncbi:hypothetical protein, partial [Bacillus sp. FJAT-27231]|uniref:hypothetical protein n=1 Tax=Bacillus sp. FJAT-27231 TaxID=1679168 RepID=UPI001E59D2DB